MANAAYDIRPERFGWQWTLPFRPYIGAGLGYAWLNFQGTSGDQPTIIDLPDHNEYVGPAVVRYGSGGSFAYQAFAGVSWPIPQVHGLEATLEYRFFGTARADVPATATATLPVVVNGAVPAGTRDHGFEVHDNIVLVGLRYKFNWPY